METRKQTENETRRYFKRLGMSENMVDICVKEPENVKQDFFNGTSQYIRNSKEKGCTIG